MMNKKNNKKHQKKLRRMCALAGLSLCLSVSLFSGCKKKAEEGRQADAGELETYKDIIIKVGDKEVARNELMFYVLCVKEQYEGYFGKEIWNVDVGGGKTFEDMCKEDILNEIVQLKVITSMAESKGVAVTEDEADEISDTVRDQMEEISRPDATKYQITTELLESIYHDNYLSSKMFDVVTGDVDTNVSDEDARQAKFQVLTLLTKGEDKNQNTVNLTKEEKETLREKAGNLRKQAKDSDDFYSLASVHSDLSEIEMTIGKGSMEAAFDKAAFRLETGDLSKVIKGKNAYYIIYCVNAFDEDATAQRKEAIIGERQDEVFRKLYEEWMKDFEVTVDEGEWEKLTFE